MLIKNPGGVGSNDANNSSRKLSTLTLARMKMENAIHEMKRDSREPKGNSTIIELGFKSSNGPGRGFKTNGLDVAPKLIKLVFFMGWNSQPIFSRGIQSRSGSNSQHLFFLNHCCKPGHTKDTYCEIHGKPAN